MEKGLVIMLEECGQNNTVYWSIILRKKKKPCPATQWLYTLNASIIEPSIHQLSSGLGSPKNVCDARVQNSP